MATPRQELIKMSAVRYRRRISENRLDKFGGHSTYFVYDAVEEIVDECRACEGGTLGYEILRYYRDASEFALTRLLSAIGQEV